MCGICGWVDWAGGAQEPAVRAMAARLVHRGPDGDGFWRDERGIAVLGHRRLRVLDLSQRAEQPMVDRSGAVLVYNGEVYSFREMKRELEAAGRLVASSGDTEVVLASLATWGEAALQRFVGMFALALFEPRRRRLLLVRDRLGVKPLFWAEVGHGLAFASELPALLAHPGVGRRLGREAVARWLQLGYTAGADTVLDGVHRLQPGHLLEAEESGLRVRAWYDLLDAAAGGGHLHLARPEAEEEVERSLRQAVSLRLVSDVPLGCFLSGGVDSTAVAAAARAEGASPETLTVVFAGGSDESSDAARTARALSLPHRVERCTADEMLAVYQAWAEIGGDPLADPSLAPTWLVAKAARRGWTVALSGDGGDELLSGYPRLRAMPRLEPLLLLSPGLRQVAPGLLPARRWAAKLEAALAAPDAWQAYQALQGVWPAAEAAALLGLAEAPPVWPQQLLARLAGQPPWRRYRLLDLLTFLPERMLAKVDRASMAHSLEVRVPLLDHRLVELLLGLPEPFGRDKSLLRAVGARLGVPALPRRKLGFEVPLARWLRGPLHDVVAADLFGRESAELGVDQRRLRSTWEAHQSGTADHAERLLAVAVLVRWVRRWL